MKIREERRSKPTLAVAAVLFAMALVTAALADTVKVADAAGRTVLVVEKADRSPIMDLAAQEVQRYVYLRTGQLLPIADRLPTQGDAILFKQDGTLDKQQYQLKTTTSGDTPSRKLLRISGGSDIAVLYGAYHLAEKLGVRFYLHGDVVPDEKIDFSLPELDEVAQPLFEIRGIQPFHDFAEGPDWWTADDYKAYCSQLAKLRMNFMGLHCYPEDEEVLSIEPTVWIGLPEDVNPDGTVRFSYPCTWTSVSRGGIAAFYAPTKTSEFAAGAAMLFADDDFGSPVTEGYRSPKSVEECNVVFNRAGHFFNDIFTHGRTLGIKFCMGTETPLIIPKSVQARIREKGLDPQSPEVIRKLYEGMFRRIALAYPLDYYWLWTPESWTWEGVEPATIDATVNDIKLAMQGLEKAGKPFGFATCGWVLGPPQDRSLFDTMLPKDVAISCINRIVGFEFVEPSFLDVKERPKWAIPWLEDDQAMTIPQLWAGRMRRDAADAHAYGCTGLLGLHWRTKVLSPNISALAQAGWDQKSWNPEFGEDTVSPTRSRDLPVDDFYADWAEAQFGPKVGKQMGELFVSLDGGTNLPRPATWVKGPGDIIVNEKDWSLVKPDYAFVEKMAAMRDQVTGKGNLARFDYWLNNFRYLQAVAQTGCQRGRLDQIVSRMDAEENPEEKKRLASEEALPARIELARCWERMMGYLLQTVSTPGEMGTVANLEQHVRRYQEVVFLNLHDTTLADARLATSPGDKPFEGVLRRSSHHVPTKRSQINEDEQLTIKVIVLDRHSPKSVALFYRPMGKGEYSQIEATHVGRGVYTVTLPKAIWPAIEYYIEAMTSDDQQLVWPPTAPTPKPSSLRENNQTGMPIDSRFNNAVSKGLQNHA